MEKQISNKTHWIFKRAELLSNAPRPRKSLIEINSSKSSVHGTSKEPPSSRSHVLSNNPTPKARKKQYLKTKSISELPSVLKEKIRTTPKGQNSHLSLKPSPASLVFDKYFPTLPSIKQINPSLILSQSDLKRGQESQELLSPSDLFESPLIKKRLIHLKRLDCEGATALTVRLNRTESLVALGCEDGVTRVLDIGNSRLRKLKSLINVPVTSVRWSPAKDDLLFQTKADGTVEVFNVETNSLVFSFIEEGNFINCSDVCEGDGSLFATAGQDARIRVYSSEHPDKVLHVYSRLANPTHANRIYSLRFHPDNNNLIVSGGWDETLILWDIRTPHTASFIYGPLICGDSMDLRGWDILTGSWRDSKQLQIWDQRNLKEKTAIEWTPTGVSKEKPFIYSCIFDKREGKYILAGSSGVNEIRLYENGRKFECLDLEVGFKKGLYSLDGFRGRNQFCYASEKSGIYSHY